MLALRRWTAATIPQDAVLSRPPRRSASRAARAFRRAAVAGCAAVALLSSGCGSDDPASTRTEPAATAPEKGTSDDRDKNDRGRDTTSERRGGAEGGRDTNGRGSDTDTGGGDSSEGDTDAAGGGAGPDGVKGEQLPAGSKGLSGKPDGASSSEGTGGDGAGSTGSDPEP